MFWTRLLGALLFLNLMQSCGDSKAPSEIIPYDAYHLTKPKEFFKNKATQAKKEGKWGWINPYGEWIIPAEYDARPDDWVFGLTVMKKGEKFGVLNSKNQIVHPFEFDAIYLNDGRGWPGTGPFITFIKGENLERRTLNDEPIDSLAKYQVTKVSLVYADNVNSYLPLVDFKVVNGKGEVQFDFTQVPFICWVGEFSDGMAPFFIGKFNGRSASGVDGMTYYGYVNEDGEMAIEPQFVANYMMMNTDDWEPTNPNFQFVNGEALVKAEDHYFAINKKGEKLRDYNSKYYRVGLPGQTGIRKADGDYLDAEGLFIFEENNSNWDMIGSFNNQGYAVQKDSKAKKFRVVNSQNKEIFSRPFWDEEFYYELSPHWPDADNYFLLNRVSIADMKASGAESYYAAPKELSEFKLLTFDLSETEWQPMQIGTIPTIGMSTRENEESGNREILDQGGKVVFSCDSCWIRYPGSDQINNKDQWLFLVRYEKGGGDYIGLNGFNFTTQLEVYDTRFTDVDASLFEEEESNENPNFILKFNEEDVARYYAQLLGASGS